MTKNAPTLPQTIAYLADAGVPSVNVLQLLDVNGRSGLLDPLLHFSAEYVESIKRSCIEIAREKRTRLIWNAGGYERHDFRDREGAAEGAQGLEPPLGAADATPPSGLLHQRPQPRADRRRRHRSRRAPTRPTTTSCSARSPTQALDEIWNSPNARDLRRGDADLGLPEPLQELHAHEQARPGGLAAVRRDGARTARSARDSQMDCVLDGLEPRAHAPRGGAAVDRGRAHPASRWSAGCWRSRSGGEQQQVEVCTLSPGRRGASACAAAHSRGERGSALRTNLGYWWALFAVPAGDERRTLRSREIRCLVRHEHVPRVEGSTLRYPDQGHLPVVDLGGEKQSGWTRARRGAARAPARRAPQPLACCAHRPHGGAQNGSRAAMSKQAYGSLVAPPAPSRRRGAPRGVDRAWWSRRATRRCSSSTATRPGISRPGRRRLGRLSPAGR